MNPVDWAIGVALAGALWAVLWLVVADARERRQRERRELRRAAGRWIDGE